MAQEKFKKPGLQVLLERAEEDLAAQEGRSAAPIRAQSPARKGRIASENDSAGNPDAIVGGRRSNTRDRRGGDRRNSERRTTSRDRRDTPPPSPAAKPAAKPEALSAPKPRDNGPAKSKPRRSGNPWLFYGFTGAVLTGLGALPCVLSDWKPLLAWMVGINLSTFLIYGLDKVLALWNMLRVPEAILLFMAAIGGTPGGIIGQGLFRHKTKKDSFQTMFWIIAALQAGLLWALFYFKVDISALLPGEFQGFFR